MKLFKILQILIGLVLIAMVWLNANLPNDQRLAFTTLIVLLLLDKFIKLDKGSSAPFKESGPANPS
jgi:hypothetical protein